MLYSPILSFGLDYSYSRFLDGISSENSMTLGMYGSITTLITKVLNDNVLLKLTTNNNM
jgi:hypothetical protein